MEIKYANAEFTGGNIYVYTGQFTDGTWFIAGDLIANNVMVMDADPEANWEDAWYPDWQEEHLIRETGEEEGTPLLLAILKNALERLKQGARMAAYAGDLEVRIEMLERGEEI